MIKVEGLNMERLVLDGEWFEKLRGGDPVSRIPAADYRGAQVDELSRKKGLFSKEREALVSATLTFEGGPFVGFTAPAEKRGELDALLAALEQARTA